jgi:hypothetical protein
LRPSAIAYRDLAVGPTFVAVAAGFDVADGQPRQLDAAVVDIDAAFTRTLAPE